MRSAAPSSTCHSAPPHAAADGLLHQHEHLHEHGGRAHLQHFGEYRGRNGHADDARRLLALDEPPQHDARLDHLRDHRGAARPLDAEPLVAQGQDEQRGQHHVEDGASSHDGHGPRQLAFAAHDHVRALREVHEQAADEHDAQVGFGQVEDLSLCAGEGQQRAREHRADDRDGERQHQVHDHEVAHHLVDGALVFRADGARQHRGRPHADHRSAAGIDERERVGHGYGSHGLHPDKLSCVHGVHERVQPDDRHADDGRQAERHHELAGRLREHERAFVLL